MIRKIGRRGNASLLFKRKKKQREKRCTKVNYISAPVVVRLCTLMLLYALPADTNLDYFRSAINHCKKHSY